MLTPGAVGWAVARNDDVLTPQMHYHGAMPKLGPLFLLTCAQLLFGCGGEGKGKGTADAGGTAADVGGDAADDSPCSGSVGSCDPFPILTSTVELADISSSIAAIETSGCSVSWSVAKLSTYRFPEASSMACPAGSAIGEGSYCVRYPCSPADGGDDCREASISIPHRCVVAVIATTGETRTFDITLTVSGAPQYCRAGTEQCVEFFSQNVSPSLVTLTFGWPDAGAGEGHDTSIDDRP
jgi:hypothetical protein